MAKKSGSSFSGRTGVGVRFGSGGLQSVATGTIGGNKNIARTSGGGSFSNRQAQEAAARAAAEKAAREKAAREKAAKEKAAKEAARAAALKQQQKQQQLLRAAKVRERQERIVTAQRNILISDSGQVIDRGFKNVEVLTPIKNKESVDPFGEEIPNRFSKDFKPLFKVSKPTKAEEARLLISSAKQKSTEQAKAEGIFETDLQKATNKFIEGYKATERFASKKVTKPISRKVNIAIGGEKGLTVVEDIEKNYRELSRIAKESGNVKLSKTASIVGGVGAGLGRGFEEKPFLQAGIVGAGAAVGAGSKFAIAGAGKLAGKTGEVIATTGLKTVGVGATGVFVAQRGSQFVSASDDFKRGEILGSTAREFSLLGAGARVGSKAAGFVTDKKVVVKADRKIRQASATEIQRDIILNDKKLTASKFKITGEKLPPRTKITTTAFREKFNLKPLDIKKLPAKKFSVTTPDTVIQGKPFKVLQVSKGSRVGRISTIKGRSEFIKASDIPKLPKTQQFAARRLIEARIGRPIRIKDIPKLIPKDQKISRALIQSQIDIDLNIASKNIKLPTIGKSTSLTQSISRQKLILETPEFKQIAVKTKFKDITKPLSRASGKTPGLRTNIIRIKEPIRLDSLTKKSNIFSLGGTKKTSFSSTFSEPQISKSITKTITPTIKPVIKPSRIQTVTKIKSPSVSQINKGLKTAPLVRISTKQRPSTDNKVLFKTREIQREKTETTTKTIQRGGSSMITRQSQTPIQDITEVETPRTVIETPSVTQTLLPSPPKPFRIPELPKKTETRIPIVRLPKIPSVRQPKGQFGVQVRRFGEFRNIGTFRSIDAALSAGIRSTGGTLAATFKLTGTGRAPKRIKGFTRKQTKTGTEFIELPKLRLSKKSETEEISLFRRKSKKKKRSKKKK